MGIAHTRDGYILNSGEEVVVAHQGQVFWNTITGFENFRYNHMRCQVIKKVDSCIVLQAGYDRAVVDLRRDEAAVASQPEDVFILWLNSMVQLSLYETSIAVNSL